jgi:hypothetical protein
LRALPAEPAHAAPQVYVVCPGVLLPVLPHLQPELHVLDDAKRCGAMQLLMRLVTLEGSTFAKVRRGRFGG